jgi:hypothetical protein
MREDTRLVSRGGREVQIAARRIRTMERGAWMTMLQMSDLTFEVKFELVRD